MLKNKKFTFYQLIGFILSLLIIFIYNSAISEDNIINQDFESGNQLKQDYEYPKFYKGIYLNVNSAKNFNKLSYFINKAKKTSVNTLVLDVQNGNSNNSDCAVPLENVQLCLQNGLHPVARIVFFQDGLGQYPVPEEIITNRLNIAEQACKNGFKEIQFDYIRFRDYRVIKHLTLEDKYLFIENIIRKIRNNLKPYNIKLAVDVFGRIPLNKDDIIGQKMEVIDKVADIICPMAYPSHYSWSNKFMSDPYYTVYLTSTSAKERVKNAEIVTYIQAFKMKIGKSNLSFESYIEEQLKAVHDAGVKGFILWNASQDYAIPFKVLGNFYYHDTAEALNEEDDDKSS